MKTFVNTAFYPQTMTTCDDPLLKVTEIDNGHMWYLLFEVGDTTIDHVNLDMPLRESLHDDVRSLPVYDEEGNVKGLVGKIYDDAVQLDKDLKEAYRKQAMQSVDVVLNEDDSIDPDTFTDADYWDGDDSHSE